MLLIDFNITYLNPTRNLLPSLLASVADLHTFGPGYVDQEVLSGGLGLYESIHGPFDLILATEHFWNRLLPARAAARDYRRVYGARISESELRQFDDSMSDFFRLSGIRIATLAETDYYTLDSEVIDVLQQTFDLFLGWNHQLLTPSSDGASKEQHLLGRPRQDWGLFTESHPERVIPFAHFVSDQEFAWTPLTSRPKAAIVPGVPYYRRRLAQRSLGRVEDFGHQARELRRRAMAGVGRFPIFSAWARDQLRQSFDRANRRAAVAYVDGSMLNYFVRKFVEVPAAGCLLVCEPFSGFEAMGFSHSKNCLVSSPSRFSDCVRDALSDASSAQIIADRGQMLVAQKHSFASRSQQIRQAFDRVVEGQFAGASWQMGELIFL